MRAVVTGASGFVGKILCDELAARGHEVVALTRRPLLASSAQRVVTIDDVTHVDSYASELAGADAVFHLAAKVHDLSRPSPAQLAEYELLNVVATEKLARRAAGAGVRRFIFASSVKAAGEADGGAPLREIDPSAPRDVYGRSKLAAEETLHKISLDTGLEYVALRPPLVYGPGVGANFLRLIRVVDKGVPLPFGRIDNRRSFVFVRNLSDAMIFCSTAALTANRSFYVSDGEDLSTPELIRRIAMKLKRKPRLLPIPAVVLLAAAKLSGRSDMAQRLIGSLSVDCDALLQAGWVQPYSVDAGLAETVAWYLDREAAN